MRSPSPPSSPPTSPSDAVLFRRQPTGIPRSTYTGRTTPLRECASSTAAWRASSSPPPLARTPPDAASRDRYYLFRFNEADKTNVTAFPPGFRMLAGDPFAREYNLTGSAEDTIGASASLPPRLARSSRRSRRRTLAGWNCLGAPEPTRVEGSGLPVDRYCSDNLRGEVRFRASPLSPLVPRARRRALLTLCRLQRRAGTASTCSTRTARTWRTQTARLGVRLALSPSSSFPSPCS